jgi:phosphate transport system ATP-binding protein
MIETPSNGRREPGGLHADAFIEVRGVSVHYGRAAALLDVDARFRPRCISALVGPSGCGKTSFLNCLNRMTDLIPGCRTSGRIRLDGLEVFDSGVDVMLLRRRVGMIFQRPNPFPMSIRRNIQLALREHGMTARGDLEGVTERVLRDVGLWEEVKDRLGASALELSGGQQQRLCIARAIALEPGVLLMDEPCSSLDPLASEVVERLIETLARQYTILLVTHNLAQARRIADEVAVFWVRGGAGRLIEQGPVREVFAHPREPETAAYVSGRCC